MSEEITHISLEYANTIIGRMIGLLGRRELPPGNAMLLSPCNQVHTFFMRFTIDVVFLDVDYTVLKICSFMKPWRLSPLVRQAKSVLELPQGESRYFQVGQVLAIKEDKLCMHADEGNAG